MTPAAVLSPHKVYACLKLHGLCDVGYSSPISDANFVGFWARRPTKSVSEIVKIRPNLRLPIFKIENSSSCQISNFRPIQRKGIVF